MRAEVALLLGGGLASAGARLGTGAALETGAPFSPEAGAARPQDQASLGDGRESVALALWSSRIA